MRTLWIILAAALPSAAAPRALTLGEAVALGLRTDPAVAQAHVERDRAKLAAFRAQLDRVSVKVNAQLQELWNRAPGTDLILGLSDVSASVSAPFFSGFRAEANVARAQSLEAAADQDVQKLQRDVALSIARLYWTVRRVSLLGDVESAALERMRQAEEIAEARTRAGIAPQIDRNRATARRLQQVATLAELKGQLQEASAELGVAIGVSDELSLTDAPVVPDRAPPPVDDLIASARDGRRELRVAQLRLDAQREGVRVAQSGYYPQLSAFALAQLGNNPYLAGSDARAVIPSANPFGYASGSLQAGVLLQINLFDTLSTYTATKDARYAENVLLEESRRVGRVIESDVRVAHAKVLRYQDQRPPLLQAQQVARDNVDILRKRYERGEALIIELLDSELELVNAERQLTDAGAQAHVAWLELDASLGRIPGATP